MDASAAQEHRSHVIDFEVDGDRLDTTERQLTPRQILKLAKIDPATHYLVQIQGRHQIPYKDKPDEPIQMHDGLKFISVSTGPTPVS
jgi:hypothetical protein